MSSSAEVMTAAVRYEPTSALVPRNMESAIRLAEMMSGASLVPVHLQGKASDCLLVIEQATRWGMSPFAVAQCTSVIKGKCMFEGKLVAAALHTSGVMSGRLNYAFEGEGATRAVLVTGMIRGETTLKEVRVALADVRTDNGAWKSQPDQQLCYSGARVWARRHAPEVMLGVYTPEEFSDAANDTTAGAIIDAATGAVTTGATSSSAKKDVKAAYAQDSFDKNLPGWTTAIEEGKTSADRLIEKTRTKGEMTADQIAKLRAIKVKPKTDAAAPQEATA